MNERAKQVDLKLHRYRFEQKQVRSLRGFYRLGFYPLAALISASLILVVIAQASGWF